MTYTGPNHRSGPTNRRVLQVATSFANRRTGATDRRTSTATADSKEPKVTVTAADLADQRGPWQAIADRTTGPGTHPAIYEANGAHPDSRTLAVGDQVIVPGYDGDADNAFDTHTPGASKAERDAERITDPQKAAARDQAERDAANARLGTPYSGTERRTRPSARRMTNTGNANGHDRRTGPTDRRTTAYNDTRARALGY